MAFFISSTELHKDEQYSNEPIDEACISLKKGFNTIVPDVSIKYFTEDDIQKLTCGNFIGFCDIYDSNIKKVFKQAWMVYSDLKMQYKMKMSYKWKMPYKKWFVIDQIIKSEWLRGSLI